MKFKYVVVGAGLAGITIAERIATQLHEKVLIIEKRPHTRDHSSVYQPRRKSPGSGGFFAGALCSGTH